VARAKGRLPGKQLKLSPMQEAHLLKLYRGGGHTVIELEELLWRHLLDGVPRRAACREECDWTRGRFRERLTPLEVQRAPVADAFRRGAGG
jgi:hypothetical protein